MKAVEIRPELEPGDHARGPDEAAKDPRRDGVPVTGGKGAGGRRRGGSLLVFSPEQSREVRLGAQRAHLRSAVVVDESGC